ncbi:tetracycline resistance protein, class H-like [Harmonia axyridis]|uniref:tetracycline resistance protein, class H-like n=1 Tax=Harmonia axyridis TaxID=115357 RepID=UPI001E275D22|nr:tetracycline resistance protein, class H-like [Harmonia axyridis]
MSLERISNPMDMETRKDDLRMNLCQKLKYIITRITVEPVIFFYILPGTMGYLATQNMNLEKACRVNIGYNTTVCDAMFRRDRSGYEGYQEVEVQNLVAKMMTVKTAIVGFFPTCLLLFFGSWSDRHSKRKPVIIVPIVGDIISYACLFVCAYFFLELSVEYSTFSDALPFALGGGIPCISLGVFSYISGISSNKDRTVRVGAVSMFQNTAIAVGNALGGLFIEPLGYKGVYLLTTIVMTIILIYALFVIKDPKIIENHDTEQNCIKDFFNLGHIKKTFTICFSEEKRSKMIVLMFLTVMIMGPFYGELTVLYLYTRYKFQWNEVNYSVYNTLQFTIQICGSTFALYFFSKYLKLNDAVLGMIAMLSKISACLFYAMAPTGSTFLIGVCIEIFHGTSHIAMRSIISKVVPPHELGQSSSVFGVCEAVMPLLFGPLYTNLYQYTLQFFPGAFYLLSAGFYLVTVFLFGWLYYASKENTKKKHEDLYYEEKPLKNIMENLEEA